MPADSDQGVQTQGGQQLRHVLAVIDGNSLLHRAFHALPPTMSAPDGRPTNALFGFASMMLKLHEVFSPNALACVFDKGKPARRIGLLPQYKAQRPPTDPVLAAQFPMVRQMVRAMGVPVFEQEGWEGDDLLGTLAAQAEAKGWDVLLVSGDRDVYQLVTNHVSVVNTKKGLSDVVVLDPQGVADLYDGITPDLVTDYYGLKGDSSDNIPGVPGVGPKKAAALIKEYGSLDEVLANADKIKGKMGENVRAHADDALLSRKVATIDSSAPVELDLDAAAWPAFDVDELRREFDELGFTRLAGRVLALVGSDAADAALDADVSSSPLLPAPDELVGGQQALDELERAVQEGAWAGLVLDERPRPESGYQPTLEEADAPGPVAYVALSSGWVVDDPGHSAEGVQHSDSSPSTGHPDDTSARILEFEGEVLVQRALVLLYGSGRVVSFGVKHDLHLLAPIDSHEPALLDLATIEPTRLFDLDVAAYLLDSNRAGASANAPAAEPKSTPGMNTDSIVDDFMPFALPADPLASMSGKSGGAAKGKTAGVSATAPDNETLFDHRAYMVALAAATLPLRQVLLARLEAEGALRCFTEVEMPLVPVLARLERTGMAISQDDLLRLSAQVGSQMESLRARIYQQAGEEFNVDSPAQLSSVLFDPNKKVKIPVTRAMKRTKTGFVSTNAKMLAELAVDHPIVADVLEYREKAKIKGTYLDALPVAAAAYGDGRVHTTYHQTVVATGRLSSSDPNLQNIPVRSELGRIVREAFVPQQRDGWRIVGCDYSQIELRLLAHLSEDDGLIAAFTQGEDFHRETAARVFGVEPADVTSQMRSRAKAVNFGIVYGQQAYGLSTSLKIPMAEAQEMIDRYFIQFPQVRAYLDSLVDFARAHGWVQTIFGRRRYVPDIYARNPNVRGFGERTAMNHPMQGSAADIIKVAMARVQRRLDQEGMRAKMVVQVHDELDFECPTDEEDALISLVTQEMTGVVDLRVPLLVSCASGPSWAQAH